jgi:hypothetical protein
LAEHAYFFLLLLLLLYKPALQAIRKDSIPITLLWN